MLFERRTMVIILFRSRLTSAAGADYAAMNAEMEEYVKTRPGFLDVKAFTAADGQRMTVVWWQDRETLRMWQEDLRHVAAKKAGRRDWYQYDKMEVAEVFRQSSFERPGCEQDKSAEIPVRAE
jgi:heme-degrading monooxygenase HmoA